MYVCMCVYIYIYVYVYKCRYSIVVWSWAGVRRSRVQFQPPSTIRVGCQTLQSVWVTAFASGANTRKLVQETEGLLDHQHPEPQKRNTCIYIYLYVYKYIYRERERCIQSGFGALFASARRRHPRLYILKYIVLYYIILYCIILYYMIVHYMGSLASVRAAGRGKRRMGPGEGRGSTRT